METCWKITKNDKKHFKDIYNMFFYNENVFHIKMVFDTWLDNDTNEIYITKNGNKWKYILSHDKIKNDLAILNMNFLLNTLN
jgi:hypothetical protein